MGVKSIIQSSMISWLLERVYSTATLAPDLNRFAALQKEGGASAFLHRQHLLSLFHLHCHVQPFDVLAVGKCSDRFTDCFSSLQPASVHIPQVLWLPQPSIPQTYHWKENSAAPGAGVLPYFPLLLLFGVF